ncbi:MAG: hypothetical protein ACREDR_27425, partial [Blastocatellia bacterium]
MYPEFLSRSLEALERHGSVGFTFPLVKRVDARGQLLNMWYEDYQMSGLIEGQRYIELTIERGRCISLAPSMVFRKSVYDVVGPYRQVYGYNTFDFNMWLRICLDFDVFHIDEPLFEYTIHDKQMSEKHWRNPALPSGRIGTAIELVDAIARLLVESNSESIDRRRYLSSKLLQINRTFAGLVAGVIEEF